MCSNRIFQITSMLHEALTINKELEITIWLIHYTYEGSFISGNAFRLYFLSFLQFSNRSVCVIMEGKVAAMSSNLETEVKSVKCSMCRKVKTSDHFINPNSDTLYHVCDNCRYLRKTKYKSISLFTLLMPRKTSPSGT